MAKSQQSSEGARAPSNASSNAAESQRREHRTDDALQKELAKRHPTSLEEALPGEEEDGGESLLAGAPREGEAKHVDRVSQESADQRKTLESGD